MSNKTSTLTVLAGAAGLAIAFAGAPAQAAIFDFDTVVEGQNPSGFRYSFWHAATAPNGQNGNIIAVFGDNQFGSQLNPAAGFYNTTSGAVINLAFEIFLPQFPVLAAPSGPSVGTIVMNGNLGGLNGFDGSTAGFLNWTATFDPGANNVLSWLLGHGFTGTVLGTGETQVSGTHYFNDTDYMGTGPAVGDPNSFAQNFGGDSTPNTADDTGVIALWGGDLDKPFLRDVDGGYVHNNVNTTLGFDAFLNLTFGGDGTNIPEPVSLALLGMGLFGLGFATRRRKV
jgi:hypothetical protein